MSKKGAQILHSSGGIQAKSLSESLPKHPSKRLFKSPSKSQSKILLSNASKSVSSTLQKRSGRKTPDSLLTNPLLNENPNTYRFVFFSLAPAQTDSWCSQYRRKDDRFFVNSPIVGTWVSPFGNNEVPSLDAGTTIECRPKIAFGNCVLFETGGVSLKVGDSCSLAGSCSPVFYSNEST